MADLADYGTHNSLLTRCTLDSKPCSQTLVYLQEPKNKAIRTYVLTCSLTVSITFQPGWQSSQRSGQKLICASMFTK